MIYIFFFLFSFLSSQIVDDFSNGTLSSAIEWFGDTSSWDIVENSTSGPNTPGAMVLRLNAPSDGSTSQYISFNPGTNLDGSVAWGSWIGRRSSSTYTGSNNLSFYLWSNSSNLKTDTLDAYRLVLGDNSGDDEFMLQRVDDGIPTTLLTGSYPLPNGITDVSILVHVFRTQTSEFRLYTSDIPGSGGGPSPENLPTISNTPVFQGSVTDATYGISNGFTGFVSNHTTSLTARTAVEIDQIYIKTETDQSLPVFISSFTAIQNGEYIDLTWTTESEIDNIGFELYRAGTNSKSMLVNTYRTDANLAGSGSTTFRSYYAYKDGPLERDISYIYTLMQVDRNGTVEEVGKATIFLENRQNNGSSVFPNPTKGRVSFNPGEFVDIQHISIYNLLGRAIDKDKYYCEIIGGRVEIQLREGLPGGYYFANIRGSKKKRSFKFLYMP